VNGLILIHGWAKHRICSELLDRNESLRTDQQRKTQPANCNFLLPKHIIDMAQKILPLVLFYFALLHCLKAQLSGGSAQQVASSRLDAKPGRYDDRKRS